VGGVPLRWWLRALLPLLLAIPRPQHCLAIPSVPTRSQVFFSTLLCVPQGGSAVSTVDVMIEYFQIWDMVDGFILHPETPDQFRWKFSQDGSYTSKSAYAAFFEGSIKFGSWRRIWKTWAPPRCKFFIWPVFHNRVWTADRLARRNLPHPEACPLCDQEDESINHFLVGCLFARQVWAMVLQQLGLLQLAPQPTATRFSGL